MTSPPQPWALGGAFRVASLKLRHREADEDQRREFMQRCWTHTKTYIDERLVAGAWSGLAAGTEGARVSGGGIDGEEVNLQPKR